jgi:hypothetical protein
MSTISQVLLELPPDEPHLFFNSPSHRRYNEMIAMMRNILDNCLIDLAPAWILGTGLRTKFRRSLRRALLSRLPKHSIGAEIGVWRGDFTQEILSVVEPRQLHIIDPWISQPQNEDRWYHHRDQSVMDSTYQHIVTRFRDDDRVVIHRKLSEDAVQDFADGLLDWVYIDGNHLYEFVKRDLELYLRKLKLGGLLTGDDYTWRPDLNYPVKRAVDETIASGRVERIWIRRGQFILRKVP